MQKCDYSMFTLAFHYRTSAQPVFFLFNLLYRAYCTVEVHLGLTVERFNCDSEYYAITNIANRKVTQACVQLFGYFQFRG
jgi:hypothetical protein